MKTPSKWIQVLVIGFLLAGLTGCAKLRARDELNKGVRAFKGGNMEEAIEHFDAALENDPELLVAQLYKATAIASEFIPGALSDKNKEVAGRAIAEFEKVLEKEPANTNALRNIASIYFNLREMEDAKRVRRRLIEVDPDNPEHYYSIGVINWTLTFEVRKALRLRLGILDKPDRPIPARDIRALAESNADLVEEGIEVLLKARELNPNDWQVATYLNLMYREKADITIDPQEREDLLHRADVLTEEAIRLQNLSEEEEEEEPVS